LLSDKSHALLLVKCCIHIALFYITFFYEAVKTFLSLHKLPKPLKYIYKLILLSSDCYLKILDCEVVFYVTPPSASNVSARVKAPETSPIKIYFFPVKISYQIEIVVIFCQINSVHTESLTTITLRVNNTSAKVLLSNLHVSLLKFIVVTV